MKRKCPKCQSTQTGRVLVFVRTESGGVKVTDDTQWQCDRCDHMWEPGKRKVKP